MAEVTEARQALREWLRQHPDESGMADAFEARSHFEDYALEQTKDLDALQPVGAK